VPARWRFGRFDLQVRIFLLLLLLFLGVLDLLNIYLLGQAKDALERSERGRAEVRVRDLVSRIGMDRLAAILDAEGVPSRLTPTAVRRIGLGLGYDRIAVLDRGGREVLSSGPGSGITPGAFDGLSEDGHAALASGRPTTGAIAPERGEDARLSVYMPVLDAAGKLTGVVEAVQPVPELGELASTYRLVLIVQLSGVLAIAGLVVLFANWISRPYRSLAAAVGEAGLERGPAGGNPDPDDLAAAFRAVAEKLKVQDETLGALGREGGLGELVRFASGPAEILGTGVLVVDRRARVAAINPVAARLLGTARADVVSRPLAEVATAVPELEPRVRSCLERGVKSSRDVLDVRGGNGSGHVGVSISPARGFEAEVGGALVLMTDLAEIGDLQEQARLRENLASVGKLSAGIAHEFRNALSTILGYARMLEKNESPAARQAAGEIAHEIESVRKTVDEFLLYARPPEPDRSRVHVGRVVKGCAATVEDFVDVEIEGEFGEVLADEGLLRRAFGNLLRNAADAVADEGRRARVTIAGRRVAAGGALQIDVEDDGPGIAEEHREQVFVPFFTTRTGGTGLGLALVQRTIVDVGGSIEAGSSPRGGARFRIRLPVASG
jgi:signal transduction histidine kinase